MRSNPDAPFDLTHPPSGEPEELQKYTLQISGVDGIDMITSAPSLPELFIEIYNLLEITDPYEQASIEVQLNRNPAKITNRSQAVLEKHHVSYYHTPNEHSPCGKIYYQPIFYPMLDEIKKQSRVFLQDEKKKGNHQYSCIVKIATNFVANHHIQDRNIGLETILKTHFLDTQDPARSKPIIDSIKSYISENRILREIDFACTLMESKKRKCYNLDSNIQPVILDYLQFITKKGHNLDFKEQAVKNVRLNYPKLISARRQIINSLQTQISCGDKSLREDLISTFAALDALTATYLTFLRDQLIDAQRDETLRVPMNKMLKDFYPLPLALMETFHNSCVAGETNGQVFMLAAMQQFADQIPSLPLILQPLLSCMVEDFRRGYTKLLFEKDLTSDSIQINQHIKMIFQHYIPQALFEKAAAEAKEDKFKICVTDARLQPAISQFIKDLNSTFGLSTSTTMFVHQRRFLNSSLPNSNQANVITTQKTSHWLSPDHVEVELDWPKITAYIMSACPPHMLDKVLNTARPKRLK